MPARRRSRARSARWRPAAGTAVVIDADPLGPGADRVLGLDGHDGVRWDALCQTTGRFSGRSLRDSLPRRDQLGVLTWYPGPQGSLQAFAVRNAIAAAQRGHDTVVLDLPRTVDPLVEEMVARCDRVFVLTVPTVAGLASTVRLCSRFHDASPFRLVLRGDDVSPDAVARLVSVPVAARMSDQRGLEEAIDLGLGPVRSRRGPLGGPAWRCWPTWRAAAGGMTVALPAELGAVVDEVRERLARRPGELTAHRVAEALRATGRPVGDATVLAVHDELRRDVLGAGPLEPLLRMPGVTDVLVNGPDGVYVDRGEGLRATDVTVRRRGRRTPTGPAAGRARRPPARRRQPVRRRPAGRRHPVHAVLAPVARPGTLLSLRVPRARGVHPRRAGGGRVADTGRRARAAARSSRRRLAFLVSGGTGSGKTTLLAALLSLVDRPSGS